MSIEGAGQICRRKVLLPNDFSSIQLVFGHAGDGKTHYIMQQLCQSPGPLTIAVNEAFTPLSAIKKLKSLPLVKDCAIFFNFTILPHQVWSLSAMKYGSIVLSLLRRTPTKTLMTSTSTGSSWTPSTGFSLTC